MAGLVLILTASGWAPQGSSRTLLSATASAGPGSLAEDRGSVGLWQQLGKLQTTASLLHTTAHPDDEHGACSLDWPAEKDAGPRC